MTNAADRHQLLEKLDQVSFVVNDLTLYLDTHPNEKQAMEAFGKYKAERKNLMKQYKEQFGPLTVDCVGGDSMDADGCFMWLDGPVPWEGEYN